ncbi:MAG: AbrB/MazE/SpoVT family DNA-binding domain-containing protein [Propionibacteriaceae bacterium]|jgi:AbrB family looped-hinge helix DNA binding protein|nr:AbrB/MazE/SpoVT family DNA-binding domain-containing protein [Propionibacteriaceae bacterium]
MTLVYSTVTAKGQITLPAEVRRRFGFRPGQKVAIVADDSGVRVEAPGSVADVRARLRAEMTAQGTWGAPLDPAAAWSDDTAERHA